MIASDAKLLAACPVSRTRALTRTLVRFVPAAICLTASQAIYREIDLSPRAGGGRLVHLAIALAALPLVIAGLACLFSAFRWILVALWPAPMGAFAYDDRLELRLGPMGTITIPKPDLRVRYLFELPDEERSESVEAFLPEDVQVASFVPLIESASTGERFNRRLLALCSGDEEQIAGALRPAISVWRGETGRSLDADNEPQHGTAAARTTKTSQNAEKKSRERRRKA